MYQTIIAEQLQQQGRPDVDPRHVEAFLRCEFGTLDALERTRFVSAEILAAIDADPAMAEQLAASYGI